LIRIDARGMRCPWPALRLARALRHAEPDAVIELLADDPAAPRECAAVAVATGWALNRLAEDQFSIVRAQPVNALFTTQA
jgi:tRNA 2-thiouridine synthesizing protein A